MKCKLWNAYCEMHTVKCILWNIYCEMHGAKCIHWSIYSERQIMKCILWIKYSSSEIFFYLKYHIREPNNLLTNLNSSTNTKKNLLSKAKFAQKQTFLLCSNFTPFVCKSFQIGDHFFPLLFPKDSEPLKVLAVLVLFLAVLALFSGLNRTTGPIWSSSRQGWDITTYRLK